MPGAFSNSWKNSIDFGALIGALLQGAANEDGPKTTGNISLIFKLINADEKAFKINTTIDGTVEMEMGTGTVNGLKIPMKFSGTGTATTERTTGIPIDSDTKVAMEMTFNGQTVNIKIEIAVKRLEIKAGN